MPHKVAWISFWTTIALWLGGLWGCAAPGEDQNYKVLEDDQPLDIGDGVFYIEPTGLQRRDEIATELGVALADETPTPDEEVPSEPTAPTAPVAEVPARITEQIEPAPTQAVSHQPAEQILTEETPIEETPVLELTDVELAAVEPIYEMDWPEETEPSLKGLDRSHWAKIKVSPSDGSTRHNPIYFVDADLRRIKKTTINPNHVENPSPVSQYDEPALVNTLKHAHSGSINNSTNALGLLVQPAKFCLDVIYLLHNAWHEPPLTVVKTPLPPPEAPPSDP